MTPKRPLPMTTARASSLGLPTIMDRTLAAAHGVRYVHLAVFAIDIDRIYWLDAENPELPFGWEVFLTELQLLAHIDQADPAHIELIESVVANIMLESPGDPPLGGQLVFAVYDAVQRKQLAPELGALFKSWGQKPRDLVVSLAQLWANADVYARQLAEHCLGTEIDPTIAPPTRAALERIAGRPEPG